jgi:glutathione S-transferase
MTVVLWHLPGSHYNEKARWALDFKRVPHIRRAALPGRHRVIAERLTGGSTLPVLIIGGEALADSTRIIRRLEQRYPEPALYPTDRDDCRRALALEDWFDEQLGPAVRLLWIRQALPSSRIFIGAFAPQLGRCSRLAARLALPVRRPAIRRLFDIDDGVAGAFEQLRLACARFRAELRPSGYLVGDSFTVADLTLAAMLSPVVAPEQFQYPQPQRGHRVMAPILDVLSEVGLADWTREIYGRHRCTSQEVGSADEQERHVSV